MLNSNCFSRRTFGLFWTLSARKHITCFIFYLSFLSFWHVSFNYYFIKLKSFILYCMSFRHFDFVILDLISNFHDDARFSTDHNTEYHHINHIIIHQHFMVHNNNCNMYYYYYIKNICMCDLLCYDLCQKYIHR
jgi:hypothetical protein